MGCGLSLRLRLRLSLRLAACGLSCELWRRRESPSNSGAWWHWSPHDAPTISGIAEIVGAFCGVGSAEASGCADDFGH